MENSEANTNTNINETEKESVNSADANSPAATENTAETNEAAEGNAEESAEAEKNVEENGTDVPAAEESKPDQTEPAAEPETDESATKEFTAVSEEAEPQDKPADGNTEIFTAVTEEKQEETPKKKEKSAKKSSKTSPVRVVILVICIAVFAFSGYKIVTEIIDGINTDKMSEDIRETVRNDNDEFEAGHDDINVPPAPIDPNVSGSGTGSSTEEQSNNAAEESGNQGNTGDAETTENTGNTEEPPAEESQTVTPEQPDNTPTEPDNTENQEYDDRTYEEEIQEQEAIPEEVDTQYYISRPSKDKDAVEEGVVIRPEEIKMNQITYLRVSNLKSLLRVNEDTVGWIYLPGSKEQAKGTPIDTAIVQTTDNEYYLTHTFDKKENENGWVYADYRCNLDSITSNYNTVIYGHARSYKMFGGLKDLDESVEWYSNGYNHFIKINTYYDETVWQIFSWYETDIYFDYIKTDFEDSNDFIRFAYDVQSKNQMEGVFEKFEFSENDRILTLSTCKGYDRAVRVAVHAKLVKRNDLTQ